MLRCDLALLGLAAARAGSRPGRLELIQCAGGAPVIHGSLDDLGVVIEGNLRNPHRDRPFDTAPGKVDHVRSADETPHLCPVERFGRRSKGRVVPAVDSPEFSENFRGTQPADHGRIDVQGRDAPQLLHRATDDGRLPIPEHLAVDHQLEDEEPASIRSLDDDPEGSVAGSDQHDRPHLTGNLDGYPNIRRAAANSVAHPSLIR
jgi:hypothetical protein